MNAKSCTRAIVLSPTYFDGRKNGIGRVAGAVSAALERAGMAPIVWSANDPGTSAGAPDRAFGRNYYRMFLEAFLTRGEGVRAIACLHVGLAPVARVLARRLRVPWFCWMHGIEVWKPLRARTRWGLSGVPLLCSSSAFTRDRAAVVNPGLGLEKALPVPLGWLMSEPPDLPPGAPVRHGVISVGRLDPEDRYKGFDTLIAAWKQVTDALPGSRLTIVGHGNDRPRLEGLAREFGVGDGIEFAGLVETEELKRRYFSAAVFAMPSENEGFGLVFAEAMAYGLPCVCGNRDASPEVVADGITGYCVQTRNPAAVAGALIALLGNPKKLAEFSDRARKSFLENFDVGPVNERMDSLVATLLAQRL
ncbi:MAG: glycosyltransferase [Chthoniobacterales bacterium]|nr:glycosyltransferase [Chthoniobacterales bacterium]